MKIRGFVMTLFTVTFVLTLQLSKPTVKPASSSGYSARVISPTIGQVVHPGQQFRIQWKDTLPNVRYEAWCEMEVWLSLDGGRTFTMCITPILNPKTTSFDWTVPDTPTNAAVLDIHFGCDGWYPESYSPQPASTFVIAAR